MKKLIFAANSPKNDTIGQENFLNKWLRVLANFLRILANFLRSLDLYIQFAEFLVNPLRMLRILTNVLANFADVCERLTNETTTQRIGGETLANVSLCHFYYLE